MNRVWILVVILAALAATVTPAQCSLIAEYTGGATNALGIEQLGTQNWQEAQAFDVVGNPAISEVQVNICRWSGSTGAFTIKFIQDNNGAPTGNTGDYMAVSVPASSIPMTNTYVSFNFGLFPPSLSPGRWWLVCKVSPDSDAIIDWQVKAWNPGNNYGAGDDVKTSSDGGATWPIIQGVDTNFRIFGTRTATNTITTITTDPTSVATSGASTITVTVKDTGGNLLQGPGQVLLTATDGSFDNPTLTLSSGQATAKWTAGTFGGTPTLTASYQGHSYGGVDYNSSIGSTLIGVVAETRGTTTTQTLSPLSTHTRASVHCGVAVKDNLGNNVNGGSVSFSCAGGGSFSPNPAAVSGGSATSYWTATNTPSTCTIRAAYSGYNSGPIVYGSSSDPDSIVVDYTDVNTTTTVKISPDYPYKGGYSFVTVEVKDASGNLVPSGTVTLSAPKGTFDSTSIALTSGTGSTKWHAPSTSGDVVITASYSQILAGGNRYHASTGTATEHVTQDPDAGGADLSCESHWNSDYPGDKALPAIKSISKGFTSKLYSALGWPTWEFANSNGWETDLKSTASGGHEDDYLDKHDFQWYSGHGNSELFTFLPDKDGNYHDDEYLTHEEAEGAWGDGDCEWVSLLSCDVLSNDTEWGKALNGAHMICGFSTHAYAQSGFGAAFAGFMISDSVNDPPHTIEQSWWIAADIAQPSGVKQRIVAENDAMFNDYIWGMGQVAGDPTVDTTKVAHSHDALDFAPVANAGGPYNGVIAGQKVLLDGSLTTDADQGDILSYYWDLDNTVSSDDDDWDRDGIDEVDDDSDTWGMIAHHAVFERAGHYVVTLTVEDSTHKTSQAQVAIDVASSGKATPAVIAAKQLPRLSNGGGGGTLQIIDNYPSLPPETTMPVFNCTSAPVGYTEMAHIAAHCGMAGTAGLDNVGNWHMVNGDNELIVNEHTGGVLYLNRARAYKWSGTPANLPDEQTCMSIAQQWLYTNEIGMDGYVADRATRISREEFTVGSRTRTSTPYQRRANFKRTIYGHPVVGPGGRITVMIDDLSSPNMFVKVGRDSVQSDEVTLNPASSALADFHRIGTSALIGGSFVPMCNQIYIDNVSVGYYEDDFLTPQSRIFPVYVLDVRCVDDKTSRTAQLFLPATDPPLDVAITSPADGTAVPYGQSITFTATVAGGKSPYTIAWDSDKDGVIGSGLSFSTSALTVNQRSSEATPHAVTVTVTDANGWKSSKIVTVLVQPTSMQNAKKAADTTTLAVLGGVVTESFSDYFYMETPNRVMGLAVASSSAPPENALVAAYGTMTTAGDERGLQATRVEILGTAKPIEPLISTIRFLGGADFGTPPLGQKGVDDAKGLNNVGLLVRVAGTVDYVPTTGPPRFVMNDGDSLYRTYVLAPSWPDAPAVGTLCFVTGVSSIAKLPSGALWRLIIPRRASDIVTLP